jgi:hypothetical protein
MLHTNLSARTVQGFGKDYDTPYYMLGNTGSLATVLRNVRKQSGLAYSSGVPSEVTIYLIRTTVSHPQHAQR